MLAKLFRYECKALLRILPVLYLASLALSAVVGLRVKEYDSLDTIWTIIGTALIVITFVLVILRFRNNFFKDEGYLMFTLPVSPWQLVASKALAALCAFLADCVVAVLFVLIIWPVSGFRTVSEFFTSILGLVEFEYGGEILAWVALLILLSAVQQLFLIYACMTVSQIAPRFRGFIGFAVYLVVLLLVEAPLNTLAFDALAIDTLSINALSEEMLSGAAINVLMTEVMLKSWIMAVIQAVFAAVYFIAAVKLLEHTFNLE